MCLGHTTANQMEPIDVSSGHFTSWDYDASWEELKILLLPGTLRDLVKTQSRSSRFTLSSKTWKQHGRGEANGQYFPVPWQTW